MKAETFLFLLHWKKICLEWQGWQKARETGKMVRITFLMLKKRLRLPPEKGFTAEVDGNSCTKGTM